MGIVISKCRWKNFLSTGNVFTEIDIAKYPLTIISGRNASGKSTLLDALCFGLFGKGFRRIPKGNLINSINGGDLVVEIEFLIGSKNYKVIRGMKPNIFEIYIDGDILNQTAIPDQQEYFEKYIIRLNWKSFTQKDILGSAGYIPFMALTTPNRREFIDEMHDLKVISTMKSILKDEYDVLVKDLDKISSDISTLETKIELENSYIDRSKKSSVDRVNRDKEEIEKTRQLINEELNVIDEFKRNIESLNEDELRKKHKGVSEKIRELEDIERDVDKKIKSYKKEISFFTNNTTCPTCTQSITDGWKAGIIDDRNDKLDTIHQGEEKLRTAIVKLRNDNNDCNEKILYIDDNKRKISNHKNTIKTYERFITKLEMSINDSEEINIEETEIQLSKNREEVLAKKLSKEELVNKIELYKIGNFLLKDKVIKADSIKKYIPQINSSIATFLDFMDLYLKFELDENFEEKIQSRYVDDFKYENLSEGEKMKVNLSILLTWREVVSKKNAMSTNVIVFDEVVDSSLDQESIEAFFKIIKTMKSSNVLIISHNPHILERFEESETVQILTFEKHKNFSRIESKI